MELVIGTSESSSTAPSSEPSSGPSATPSSAPSSEPSGTPSESPSVLPSATPSSDPSSEPSSMPSATPSSTPSATPSMTPSAIPSVSPSSVPSSSPTEAARCVYTFKCGQTVYLCGIEVEDYVVVNNGRGFLGGCNQGRAGEIVKLDDGVCFSSGGSASCDASVEQLANVCPNGRSVGNVITGYCQNAADEKCFCCDKVETSGGTQFPLAIDWPDDYEGDCTQRRYSFLRN